MSFRQYPSRNIVLKRSCSLWLNNVVNSKPATNAFHTRVRKRGIETSGTEVEVAIKGTAVDSDGCVNLCDAK